MQLRHTICCLLGIGVATLTIASANAQEPVSSIIVFDGSGSMWARLESEKVAKFVTAREALKASLAKLKPETRVGLAAFGHRRQGDCSDVQVIVAVEPLASGADKINGVLDKFYPKGKAPLTATLKEAAKALPRDAGPKSLVLIHDDVDNCVPDACAGLADIQAAAPGVVIHVVGLALKPEDAQKYQCLAKATGGRLIDAQTPALVLAGLDEVLGLLGASGVAPPPTAPPPTVASRPVVPVAAQPAVTAVPAPGARVPLRTDGAPALRLATVLIGGRQPTMRTVDWIVRRADAAPTERVAFTGSGQDFSVPLPPGDYLVDVHDGLVMRSGSKATVAAAGEAGLDVVLDAGLLRASVPADVAANTLVKIFEAAADGTAAKAIGILPARQLADGVALPVGKWIVRLGDVTASIDRPIEVTSGGINTVWPVWPFGRVQITVAGVADGARQPIVVIAYEDDPDAPRGRREVARSSSSMPDLVLPAGTYALVARQGAVEARDRVALQGGEMIKRTLTLAGVRLSLTSRLAGVTAASVSQEEPVAYRIERLDVVPAEIFAANRHPAEIDLPAGRYRIEARHGLVNARASREVTLTAGQAATVAIEQQAGTLRFTGPPGTTGDLSWEILDDTGHPLWSTVQTAPRATLQAGRYIVRLDVRDKRIERRIDVRAGQTGTVEIRD